MFDDSKLYEHRTGMDGVRKETSFFLPPSLCLPPAVPPPLSFFLSLSRSLFLARALSRY